VHREIEPGIILPNGDGAVKEEIECSKAARP
jgi:hypothetical protein